MGQKMTKKEGIITLLIVDIIAIVLYIFLVIRN